MGISKTFAAGGLGAIVLFPGGGCFIGWCLEG